VAHKYAASVFLSLSHPRSGASLTQNVQVDRYDL